MKHFSTHANGDTLILQSIAGNSKASASNLAHLYLTRKNWVDPLLLAVACANETAHSIVVTIKHVHELLAGRGMAPLETLRGSLSG